MDPQQLTPEFLSAEEQRDVKRLYESLTQGESALVSPAGDRITIPGAVHAFLARLLKDLAEGKSVALVHRKHELTTLQAASFIGVSRQFLVNLLESGTIPFHKVGTHRRIYMKDLFEYKRRRDEQRGAVLDELSKADIVANVYERLPVNVQSGQ
jgi:excisionase family DNA binding protein